MKPILFNTDMVRAILDGRKTVTRRVVKGADTLWEFDGMEANPAMTKIAKSGEEYPVDMPGLWAIFESDGPIEYPMIRTLYQPGDILYVRETWQQHYDGSYAYRAGHKFERGDGWRPSIHMPKEAARIFLRVTDVRVDRLQDITNEQAIKEGAVGMQCDHPGQFIAGGAACCVDCMNTVWLELPTANFMELWDSTIKPADRTIYGWAANPWVWVIEFERISREEALRNA